MVENHRRQERMPTATPSHWEALGPALFAPPRMARARADVESLLRLVQIEAPASILDLGSGPGVHAVELARRGHRVTGIDFVESFVELSRRAAADAGVDVRFLHGDIREFVEANGYDVALCIYNTFGFLPDADNVRVLGNVRASLRKGGKLVLDIASREVVEQNWRDLHAGEVDDALFIERRSLEAGGTILVSRWAITSPRQRYEFVVRQRLHDRQTLAHLLEGAGFASPQFFGGLDGKPFDDSAASLVAVAAA